jgi:hypothetical protein
MSEKHVRSGTRFQTINAILQGLKGSDKSGDLSF